MRTRHQPGCGSALEASGFPARGAFGTYLPGLLRGCVDVTWTRLRHIVAVGLVPLASAEQLAGLAAAMQSSERKLREVYQDNRREVAIQLGGEL